ncbi:MAG: S-layer homology domain-containing protein [Clostridia bacterium]|nr:S-layer homology domain-containing protein [Clostridia bacterium]
MKKKLLCVLLAAFYLIAGLSLSVGAADVEHVINGSFETIKADGKADGWGLKGTVGSDVMFEKDAAHDGEKGAHMKTSGNAVFVSQRIETLVPGATYTLSAWLKVIAMEGNGAEMKLEFYGSDGGSVGYQNFQYGQKNADNTWGQVSKGFTVPAGTAYASLLVRNTKSTAELYWDAISIVGEGDASAAATQTPSATTKPATTTTTTTTGAPVEGVEHVVNGGFETVKDGKPEGWGVGGKAGTTLIFDKTAAYEGQAGAAMKPSGKAVHVSQRLTSLIPGKEYTFSGWLKVISMEGAGAEIKLEFYGGDGKGTGNARKSYDQNAADNTWKNITFNFTVPEGTEYASFLVRNTKTAGELYWDSVSIIGEGQAATQPAAGITGTTAKEEKEEEDRFSQYVPMPETSEELIRNGGFEELTDDGKGLQSWTAQNGWGTTQDAFNISLTHDVVHSGETAVHVKATSANPWIKQNINNPVAGATYQANIWYKIDSSTAQPGFKIEWYKNDAETGKAKYINGVWVRHPPQNTTTDGWVRYSYDFTVPEACDFITYYVRLYTASEEFDVYFDDASCYIIKDAPKYPAKLSTDEIFYYSDMFEGRATVTFNYNDFPNVAGADVSLKKDGTAIESTYLSGYGVNEAIWRFPLGKMVEKDAYTLEVITKDANGNPVGDPICETIHKYPRPATMAADGTMLVDGKPFYPVFVYHMYQQDLKHAPEYGINTSQAQNGTTLGPLKQYLDEAQKYGVKCLVPLYRDMKPAGHPDNVANTTEVINGLKDHPALLAWMVMDEATSHWPDRWDLFYASYKLIRDLDPDHPVYMLQNNSEQFKQIGKYTDILAYDPYPPANVNFAQRVTEYTEIGVDGVEYEKPLWCLNKAYGRTLYWDESNPASRGLVTVMEERNLWYQALMADASVAGYYSYSDCIVLPEKVPMHETWLHEGLTEFAKEEMGESYAYFLEHKYPTFTEVRNNDEWHSAWVKDGAVYMVVLNRFEEQKAVSIPLTSDNGAVKIGAFIAQRIYGGTETLSGDGTLSITLEPSAAYVYKITPSAAVDFSSLKTTKFHDLDTHSWAAQEIRDMEALGLIRGTSESSFMPGRNITRAEFAEFLINTLGLTSDNTENFADVNPDAPYAKAIATGKALGVLQGVGNNVFNPNAEISRQDLMVICARGMRLANKLGAAGEAAAVASFPDGSLIADYAVADVSAMVQDGVIKGNADGTINPLGNATRAEAALIMYRIYNK